MDIIMTTISLDTSSVEDYRRFLAIKAEYLKAARTNLERATAKAQEKSRTLFDLDWIPLQ